jgi:hypothetical protein
MLHANVRFPPIADIGWLSHFEVMKNNRVAWGPIYLAGFAIFFGGYFARAYESEFFPFFVGFCMLFALATGIYWLRMHKTIRRD